MSSIFCTATFGDAVSVYLFHDVDADQVGHLNRAFASVSLEAVVFTLIVGTGVALFTWIGTRLLHLKGKGARPGFALLLGVGVTVCQYLCDFATRALFPSFGQSSLTLYLVLAIAVCSVIFLRQKTADKL